MSQADDIHQRLERFVPTFQQLISIGLFTKSETDSIISQRFKHEYRLKSKQVKIDDYMNYIKYETAVLELTEKRKIEKGIDSSQRLLSDSDWPKHINSLFIRATHRFSGNFDLWMTYFDYCQSTHSVKALNKAFAECVRFHGSVPKLWKRIARWEMYEDNNIELAKDYMEEAIKKIPGNASLYALYAETILALTRQIEGRREIQNIIENSDTLKAPLLIYQKALKECKDKLNVVKKFVELFKKFDQSIDKLIEYGIETKDVNVLCYVAENDEKPDEKFNEFIKEYPSRELKVKYADYLGKNNKCDQMLKILDELDGLDDDEAAIFINYLIQMKAYKDAEEYINDNGDLTPKLQELKVKIIDSTAKDNDDFIKQMESFLKVYNSSERIDQYIYCLARRNIPDNQWISIFKSKACYIPQESVAKAFKFTYLQYKDDVALKLMEELLPIIVPSPEFIETCIDILKKQKVVDTSKIRSLYELNTTKWGNTNTQVWIDYCQYEYENHNLIKLETLRGRANRYLSDSSEFNRIYQEKFCKSK